MEVDDLPAPFASLGMRQLCSEVDRIENSLRASLCRDFHVGTCPPGALTSVHFCCGAEVKQGCDVDPLLLSLGRSPDAYARMKTI